MKILTERMEFNRTDSHTIERYEATLSVEVELFDETGFALGRATASVNRSITVPEDASLIERETTWYGLTKRLMDDLDGQLEKTLRSAFFKYLKA